MNVVNPASMPFALNPFFSHYGFKIKPLEWSIPHVEGIIKNSAFQQDPHAYFEGWKKENPEWISGNEFSPVAAVVRKVFGPFMEEGKKPSLQLIDTLCGKLAVYQEAHEILQNIQRQVSKTKPSPTSAACLHMHIEGLQRKESRSLAEEKVLNKMKEKAHQAADKAF